MKVEKEKLGKQCLPKESLKWTDENSNCEYQYIDLSSVDRISKSIVNTIAVNKGNAPSRAKQMVHTGDILFGTTRPLLKRSCVVTEEYDGQLCSTGFCLLRPNTTKVDSSWLHHAICSDNFYNYIEPLQRGVAYPAVSDKDVYNYELIIPPISIQRSIASELDSIQSMIDGYKSQLSDLDKLAESIFLDMFGNVETNIKNFPIKKLPDFFSIITDGTHQTPTYTENKDDAIKFLSAKDVVKGFIDWSKIKYIPYSLHLELMKRISPKRNDILLCKNGTTGKCALVETDEIFDIYVSLALLRPKDDFVPIYLVYAINNPYTKRQFDGSLKGIGVPNLHLVEIKKTTILSPPLSLQQQFAERVEKIEAQKSLLSAQLKDAEMLMAERMQYYFS